VPASRVRDCIRVTTRCIRARATLVIHPRRSCSCPVSPSRSRFLSLYRRLTTIPLPIPLAVPVAGPRASFRPVLPFACFPVGVLPPQWLPRRHGDAIYMFIRIEPGAEGLGCGNEMCRAPAACRHCEATSRPAAQFVRSVSHQGRRKAQSR
jgi:hypothetical protein